MFISNSVNRPYMYSNCSVTKTNEQVSFGKIIELEPPKELTDILGFDGFPVYKRAVYDADRKHFRNFVYNRQNADASRYNSSKEIQEETGKALEKVEQYLRAQIAAGNVQIEKKETGRVVCKLENGIEIEAIEPFRVVPERYQPDKMLYITSDSTREKIELQAYSNYANHMIFTIMDMLEKC